MLDAGLCVTVNSDDPAYFGGYMNANFVQTVQALDLSEADVIQLARNSFEASFVDDGARSRFMQMVTAARSRLTAPLRVPRGACPVAHPLRPAPGWVGLVWLLAWVAVVLLQKQTDLLNLTMVLVMASALSALWLAPAVALCASLASGMVFNYVLVPPKGEFALAFDQHHVFLLLTVVALSWIIARLMAGQRALAAQERLYALRAEQLQGLGEALRDAENPRPPCAPVAHGLVGAGGAAGVALDGI